MNHLKLLKNHVIEPLLKYVLRPIYYSTLTHSGTNPTYPGVRSCGGGIGNIEGCPLGGFSDGMSGGEVEGGL